MACPSEGFSREAILDDVCGAKLVRVNVSPFLNFARRNTFFWKISFHLTIGAWAEKRNFLADPEKIIFEKELNLDLYEEVEKLIPNVTEIIIASGYQKQSETKQLIQKISAS